MQRLSCDYYPCHFSKEESDSYQDCTFCFCPFYPCFDDRTGGRFKDELWDCEACIIIHREDVVDMIMESLMLGDALEDIWDKVESHL